MKLAVMMSAVADFPINEVAEACNLARALDDPLTGIATTENSFEYYPAGGVSYVDIIGPSVEVAEENLNRCADRFKALCEEYEVGHEWFGLNGFMRMEWGKLSPYFDVAIVTSPLSAPEMATIGISATLQIGDDTTIDAFDDRCVIAWDGSPQAGRAVRAALPLLPRFERVDVIVIDPKYRSLPHDIGSYLAANGIAANIVLENSADDSVAGVILDEAEHADLLVMGAYGFSATLERWFGGVTETIRTECTTPVLFAH